MTRGSKGEARANEAQCLAAVVDFHVALGRSPSYAEISRMLGKAPSTWQGAAERLMRAGLIGPGPYYDRATAPTAAGRAQRASSDIPTVTPQTITRRHPGAELAAAMKLRWLHDPEGMKAQMEPRRRKAVAASQATMTTDAYRERGRKGGLAARAQLSPDAARKLGRMGGTTTLKRYGAGHFKRLRAKQQGDAA